MPVHLIHSRNQGKTLMIQIMLKEFIAKNPESILISGTLDGIQIEKPIPASDVFVWPKRDAIEAIMKQPFFGARSVPDEYVITNWRVKHE